MNAIRMEKGEGERSRTLLLVEILVVIVLVSLLVAIAIPAYQKARHARFVKTFQSSVFHRALFVEVRSAEDYFPTATRIRSPMSGVGDPLLRSRRKLY